MKILITGGTVFVSKYMAEYFIERGHDVYVLNRNTRPQPLGAKLIQADRNDLKDCLKCFHFDAVIDVNAYTAEDVNNLLNALDEFSTYILISSSAVYPETADQPFTEDTPCGANKFWGAYGLNKIAAEKSLFSRVPNAYAIRPPYIYGEYNNVYREAFIFDCAINDLPFYIPERELKLQFIHVEDVCRFAEILIKQKPEKHVYNIGTSPVTAREWVTACYNATNKRPTFISVSEDIEQRNYFPFYAYSYELDTLAQQLIMPDTMGLNEGISRAYTQYLKDKSLVNRKTYLEYIEKNLKSHE